MNDRAPLKVLLVEDEALPALLLRGFLEDSGHAVVGWATTAAEALELLSHTRPDFAFVDLHLADGLTGIDVAKSMTASHLPFVFVTANSRMLPADFAGAVGVIAKPYTMHGIKRALEYIEQGLSDPPPRCEQPSSLALAPNFQVRWQ